MSDYIDDIFGVSGALAKRFPGYSPRAGQVALARAVDSAIRDRGHLLAEAPTGTGKSLAYSVPAIYHAVQPRNVPPQPPVPVDDELDGVSVDRRYQDNEIPRGRAIIVTANIALQEQLVRKDLPLLKEVLPWKFSYALLKGVANYLCRERLYDVRYRGHLPDDAQMDRDIREWAEETETGDKSELSFEPPARLWSNFSVSSDECSGKDCQYFKSNCFPRLARKAASEADVIVTNYALFFLDMRVREASNGMASILPPYNIAILDEGHKAVDIARDYFGFRVTEGAIDWAGSMLPTDDKIALHRAQHNFFRALREHRKSAAYKARIRMPDAVNAREVIEELERAANIYLQELKMYISDDLDEESLNVEDRKHCKKLRRKRNRLFEIRDCIKAAMRLYALPKRPWEPHPDTPVGETPETRWYYSNPLYGGDNSVKSEAQLRTVEDIFFIEEDERRVSLCSMPISVAERLRTHLFQTTDSVSVTSATLVARGSFEYMINDLGIERPRMLIAESPFNWPQQALLVMPQDVPEPNAPDFTAIVVERFAQTMELAKGRTLGLFTSYKALNAAYDRAKREGERLGYRVFRQGDMPRTALINEFRKDVQSVLLGTESFWAGVDVQGESLSCVFIDRLPFATPDDPLLDVLSEHDKAWFMKYSVPQAIIAFKQGFGRLIRTTTDRGVVVLCDRRITTKFYGQLFLLSLPPVQRSMNLEDVRRFLDGEPLLLTGNAAPSSRSLFDVA